ncbi:alpha/beta hydrolase family protein [Parvibaculum sp.]|uniref:alpha/beta hydrolase family protein n=1 Tax=Parvibaculum sp. TaxID=2024848 RepID=UPI00391B567F
MTIRAWIAAAAVLLAGYGTPPPVEAPPGIELTPLKTYSRIESWILLRLAGLGGVPVAHAVDTYRIAYPVELENGDHVMASGLLALPRGTTPKRIVSFHHGTSTSREAVPSRLDVTGAAASILFAGNGYMLLAPDYLGLGDSMRIHGYYVTPEHVAAVTALIAAARQLPDAPGTPVFLSGFSQGGHVTLAAQRDMEARGEAVLAAAPVAAALDIRNVSLAAAMKGGAPSHSLYLSYLAWSHAHHYAHPLETALTADHAALVERLFGTPHEPDEIVAALPENPREMFTPEFLAAFDEGGSHWLLDTIAAAGLTGWTPQAPVRLYYGAADADVVPEEATHAKEDFRSRGADATAVNVGDAGHEESMLRAAPLIFAWLKELEATAR